ncbi:MAG: hypothetical protein KCHDKBKB_02985 [Elusimicrobia bacterium]|nr:hypothetical protein [Elusimicrobiota bacterium]
MKKFLVFFAMVMVSIIIVNVLKKNLLPKLPGGDKVANYL